MTSRDKPRQHNQPRVRAEHWPAVGALAVTTALGVASATGSVSATAALAAATSSWAAATGALGLALGRRGRKIRDHHQRLLELEERQTRFGSAENLAAFGMFMIDRARGRLLWSPGAFRLFGIDTDAAEPSPRQFIESIHPDDRKRWIAAHRRVFKHGGEAVVEFRYLLPAREPIWIRSVARALPSDSGRIRRLEGVAQDVTGMHSMRQKLASSEAKFRDLTSMGSDWIWETDPAHCWSLFSDGAASVLGPWIGSMIGRRVWELSADQVAFEQPNWNAQRALMSEHRPFDKFEYALISPDRRLHFLSLSGRPAFDHEGRFVGYRGVGRDVTGEKQQRLLLHIESNLASLMREKSDPDQVVTGILENMCASMGWLGGVNLVPVRKGQLFTAHERAGDARFLRMISGMPREFRFETGGIEEQTWQRARPVWIDDLSEHPALARMLRADEIGAKAAFLVPLVDESGKANSLLVCASPASYIDDGGLRSFGELLSRTLSVFLQGKAAERLLMRQSLHDALTDLPNRVYLTSQLEQRLARDEPAAILYLDLDRYKVINDTLGHAVGDQVLVEVAKRMTESIREEDVACRIGGDEFIVLLTKLSDRAEIEQIGRRVLAAIEKPFMLMNRAHFISASIGVAIAPDDAHDAQHLIKCADSAMYRVKSEGRNDIRFFAGGMSDERTEQLALASELPLAMNRGDVEFYYQPIMDVSRGRIVGIEALMRWHHPTRGVLLPERFLPIAEQSKLIREIGQWALRRTLDDRVSMGLDRFPEAAVSVNVSPRQISDEEFLPSLKAMLTERNFPGRLLRLELTESAFIENPERTAALIVELRSLGIQVIIDNFGTGYASLSYLKSLPVDGLKIDRSFVRDLPGDRGNLAIVESITTLAARLGLQAMALGVETAADMRVLREANCELLQGALICEPLPREQAVRYMDSMEQTGSLRYVRAAGT